MNLTPPISSIARRLAAAGRSAHRQLTPGVGEVALQLAALRLHRLDPSEHLGDRGLELVGQRLGHRRLIEEVAPRRLAGQGLDPPDTRGDPGLGDDLEQGDVAGARHMGAAAQLHRIVAVAGQGVAEGQHPYAVAVLLAEQGHGPGVDRRLRRHLLGLRREVLADDRVDLGLDRVDLRRRHRAAMAEVEPHPVAVDQLSLLRDVRAQHIAQRGVDEVGGRVVQPRARPPLGVDGQAHARPRRQRAAGDLERVDVQVAGQLAGVADHPGPAVPLRLPEVPAWPPLSA